MEEKHCLECDRIFFGRADKKFCSDACRNAYNNREQSTENTIIKKVNRILRKNRQILKKLNPDDKAKVSMQQLSQEAFNFHYFTHNYVTKTGKEYRFCYEYGYLMLGENFVLLVKRDVENF